MKLLVTAAAAGLAVTLAQVKLHLRLDPSSNHEDDLLRMLIKVSMERASHETGRALLTTGYSLTADSRERLKLPKPNLIAISAVTKYDDQGNATVCTTDDYTVIRTAAIAEVKPLVRDYYHIVIAYTAGYGADASYLPAPICQWILVDLATLYENREAFTLGKAEVANAIPYPYVGGLLDPYRVEY